MKNVIKALSVAALTVILVNAFKQAESAKLNERSTLNFPPVSTISNVKIGTQFWTVNNLNTDTFRNGDKIPEAKNDKEWENAGKSKQPVWCYYKNNQTKGKMHGKIYDWHAVNDARGLAPVGYHIPDKGEWAVLIDYLGAGSGNKMKARNKWVQKDKDTNQCGFNGLPLGRRYNNGQFEDFGHRAFWWTSDELPGFFSAWVIVLHDDEDEAVGSAQNFGAGCYIRCVKDFFYGR